MRGTYKNSLMKLVHKLGFINVTEAATATGFTRATLYRWFNNAQAKEEKLIPALKEASPEND